MSTTKVIEENVSTVWACYSTVPSVRTVKAFEAIQRQHSTVYCIIIIKDTTLRSAMEAGESLGNKVTLERWSRLFEKGSTVCNFTSSYCSQGYFTVGTVPGYLLL